MDLQEAINHAKRGHAVAFLGSGFSLGATNESGLPVPSATALGKTLADKLGIDPSSDLQVIAELFEEEFGETELRRKIISEFTAQKVSASQKTLIALPWRRLYTTNYDDVAELAGEEANVRLNSVTLNDAPDRQAAGARVLVHLHGSVRPFTKNQGLESRFQLTSGSYFSTKFPTSPWSPAIRADFLFSRAVFFIGYSLSDFDIARMVYDDADVIRKTFIVCKDGTPDVEKRRLANFGTVLPIGIDELSHLVAKFDPATAIIPPANLVAFREWVEPKNLVVPSQDSYVELLTTGRFRDDVYAYSRQGDARYATPRHALGEIQRNDGARRIVVHSGLGNGKSLFIRELGQDLLVKGFKVYEFTRRTDAFPSEIAAITREGNRVCLMFDNLFAYKDVISFAHTHVGRDDLIVCTCRTLQYELNEDEVKAIVGEAFVEIDLNVLTGGELTHISAAFDSYGLWGKKNSLPEHKKRSYLASECSAEIRSIVLFGFGSGPVSEKIKHWSAAIEGADRTVRIFVLSAVLLSIVHADISFLDLCDMLELRPQEIKRALQTNDAADLVMSSDTRRIGVRSAILAEHLASRSFEPETVLGTLTTLVRRLADWLPSGRWAQDILRELLRLAVVGRLFDTDDRKDFIVEFYESIREIEFCRQNPQFWLQYAMARIDRAEYQLADKLLGVAESRAAQLAGYNTFQIDNQKARFLLLSRARSNAYSDHQRAYLEATKLIFRQTGGSRKYSDPYPLRLIAPHEEFISKRRGQLDEGSLSVAKSIVREFSKRLESWPPNEWVHEYKDWIEALNRTQVALELE